MEKVEGETYKRMVEEVKEMVEVGTYKHREEEVMEKVEGETYKCMEVVVKEMVVVEIYKHMAEVVMEMVEEVICNNMEATYNSREGLFGDMLVVWGVDSSWMVGHSKVYHRRQHS